MSLSPRPLSLGYLSIDACFAALLARLISSWRGLLLARERGGRGDWTKPSAGFVSLYMCHTPAPDRDSRPITHTPLLWPAGVCCRSPFSCRNLSLAAVAECADSLPATTFLLLMLGGGGGRRRGRGTGVGRGTWDVTPTDEARPEIAIEKLLPGRGGRRNQSPGPSQPGQADQPAPSQRDR